MEFDPSVLGRLRCMHTASPLHLADTKSLQAINQAVIGGKLYDGLGRTIVETFEAGLLNREGTIFYPIINGVIQMLRDELIEIKQLN